jgi:hypothetical protein
LFTNIFYELQKKFARIFDFYGVSICFCQWFVIDLYQMKGHEMTELELEERWDEMLDDSQELIKIGNMSYLPSQVLKAVDPIAYRIGKYEFADLYLEDNEDD